MLKKWISEIRAQSDLYNTDCWKYHVSGNVIELSILPAYMKQKETYRCSVIAVGQVLRALSKRIEEQHMNFHIQSFSSLENPEIVATIRTDEKDEFTSNPKWKEKKAEQDQDMISILGILSTKYQLEIQSVESQSIKEYDEIPVDDYPTWVALYSKINNPFTWLNIGYLKESLKSKCSDSSSSEELYIIDFCSDDLEQYSNLQLPKNKYLQSLIGIQRENISAR